MIDLFFAAVLAVVLVLAAIILRPYWSRLRHEAAWAAPAAIAIVATLLDARGSVIYGPFGYVGLAATLLAAVAFRAEQERRARGIRITAAVLATYAIVGTIIGRIAFDTPSGAFPMALPLLILTVGWTRRGGDTGVLTGLRLLAALATLFTLLLGAQRRDLLPWASASVLSHEKAFLGVLAIACAIAGRSIILTIVSSAAMLWTFTAYPAGTFVLAAATGIATVAIASARPGRATRRVMAATLVAGALWATLNVTALIRESSRYFLAVGKLDNGETRIELYQTALHEIARHPWFSEFFTGNLTVVIDLSGQRGVSLPIHNDYLGVALGGGIAAAFLLLLIFALINGVALGSVRADSMSRIERRAVIALLAAVNAAAATAFANPVLMNPGTSTAVYALALACVSLSLPRMDASGPKDADAATSGQVDQYGEIAREGV